MQKSINFVKGPLLSFDNDEENTIKDNANNKIAKDKKDIASLYRKIISSASTAKKEPEDIRNPLTFYINRQINKEKIKNKKITNVKSKNEKEEWHNNSNSLSKNKNESFYCNICKMIVNIPKMKHIHGVPHILSNKELENNGNQAEFHLNGDNVGYQLLVKQGWNEQSGLGSNEDGKLYPVRVNYKHDKKGIGIKERPIIKNQKQKDERLLEESKAEKLYNKLSYEDKYSSLLPSNIYKYDSISNEEYSILSNINQEFQNTLPNPSPTVSQLRKHQKTIETLDLAKKKGIILNSGDSSTSFVKQDKILKKIIKKQRNKEKKELKNKILKEEKSRLKLLEYLKN